MVNADALPFLKETAGRLRLTPNRVAAAVDRVEDARMMALGNVNPQLFVAGLLLELESTPRRCGGLMDGPKRPGDEALTHLDDEGSATMVDVTGKATTSRRAVARGILRCSTDAYRLVAEGGNPKGDVEQVARVAGIMAGKRTGELIPLCHLLPAASIGVEIEPDAALPGLVVTATARIAGRTGVEMEALTAVAVALLTAYDMLKAADRSMTIGSIRLVEKSGGRAESDRPATRPESGSRRRA